MYSSYYDAPFHITSTGILKYNVYATNYSFNFILVNKERPRVPSPLINVDDDVDRASALIMETEPVTSEHTTTPSCS